MLRDIFPGPMYERLSELPQDVVGGQILTLASLEAQKEYEQEPPIFKVVGKQPERLENERGVDMRLANGELYLTEYDSGIYNTLYPYLEDDEGGKFKERELYMTQYDPIDPDETTKQHFATLNTKKKSVFEMTIPMASVAGKSIFSFLFFLLEEFTYGFLIMFINFFKFTFENLTWFYDSPIAGWIFLLTLQWHLIYLVTGLRTPSVSIGVNLGFTFVEPALNWEFNPGNYAGDEPDNTRVEKQVDAFFELFTPDWDSPCELYYKCIIDTNEANNGKYNGVTFHRPRGIFEFLWYLLGQEEVADTVTKMTGDDCRCSKDGKLFLDPEENTLLYRFLENGNNVIDGWLSNYSGTIQDTLIREGWLSIRESDGDQIFRIDDNGGVYPVINDDGDPKNYDWGDRLFGINNR